MLPPDQNTTPVDAPARPSEEMLRAAHIDSGADRPIAARRPQPGEENLRSAYLDLLKLSLVDLAGARPLSVGRSGDGRDPNNPVFLQELTEDQLPLRVKGADWPYGGLTMVGLTRLDDVQKCVESVVADGVEGDLIEAGTWRGGTAMLMRATLDSLGEEGRTVVVADSFQGLPPPDEERFPQDRALDLSRLDYLAVPVDEVRANFARFGLDHDVEYVEGFFDQTLPTLRDRKWSVIRLDGDTYESTWLGLDSLYAGLQPGGYVLIDDYLLIEECRAAVADYRREHGITEPIEEIDWNSVRWRRESDAEIKSSAKAAEPAPERKRAVERPPRAPLPTKRELELEREVVALRQQLAERSSKTPRHDLSAARQSVARLRARLRR